MTGGLPTPGGGKRPPPGVVLDCDGVLVDSEPSHARATTRWASTIGISLRPEHFHDLIGMTVFDQIARIVEGTGHDPIKAYHAREEHFWSLIDQIEPMAGVVDLIHRLHAAGTGIAVASNGSRAYVQHIVDTLKIGTVIEGFVCADDITHPKPDPEPYLKATSLLDLAPSACVAIEDSQSGLTSALTAGLSVIMINPAAGARTTYPDRVRVVVDHHRAGELLFGAPSI